MLHQPMETLVRSLTTTTCLERVRNRQTWYSKTNTREPGTPRTATGRVPSVKMHAPQHCKADVIRHHRWDHSTAPQRSSISLPFHLLLVLPQQLDKIFRDLLFKPRVPLTWVNNAVKAPAAVIICSFHYIVTPISNTLNLPLSASGPKGLAAVSRHLMASASPCRILPAGALTIGRFRYPRIRRTRGRTSLV